MTQNKPCRGKYCPHLEDTAFGDESMHYMCFLTAEPCTSTRHNPNLPKRRRDHVQKPNTIS